MKMRTPTNLNTNTKEVTPEHRKARIALEKLIETFNEREWNENARSFVNKTFLIDGLALFSSDQVLQIIYNCDYEDRHLAKNAGFCWNNLKKRWVTTDVSVAKNADIDMQKLQEIIDAFEIFKNTPRH
jgi:hypothetical protein